jgi:hypothetical protein
MSTGAIIAVVVGGLIVLALIAVAGNVANRKRRRTRAASLQREADAHSVQAETARADAEEKAAHAQRAEAEAQERQAQARREAATSKSAAAQAEQEAQQARTRHDRARSLDPDRSDSGEDEARAIDEEVDSEHSPASEYSGDRR